MPGIGVKIYGFGKFFYQYSYIYYSYYVYMHITAEENHGRKYPTWRGLRRQWEADRYSKVKDREKPSETLWRIVYGGNW